jgi:hypothetical protein
MACKWLLAAAAGVALSSLAAGPVRASPCTDQIDALERRLNETAATAGSASSGGQAVAAAREGQAMEARDRGGTGAGAPAVPFQSESREAQATQRATEAGAGGDRVMQARATLNQARTLDAQGNATGCIEAVGEARRQLGN